MSAGRGHASVLRRNRDRDGDEVLHPTPAMKRSELIVRSTSLVVAGVMLARGFIGLSPGRPTFVILGVGLVIAAVYGLASDHVAVRAAPEDPDTVLSIELNRCRRNGHHLTMVRIPAGADDAVRIVATLRTTDVAWREQGDLMALLTETDREGGRRFVARTGGLVEAEGVRIATFPDDALTTEALRAAVTRAPLPKRQPRSVPKAHAGVAVP